MDKVPGGFAKGLAWFVGIIGLLVTVLSIVAIGADSGAESALDATILVCGLSSCFAGVFMWCAGKALELLFHIKVNTGAKS